MRIVIDVSDLSPVRGKSRGIYSYAKQLIPALLRCLADNDTATILCNGDSLADFADLRSKRVDIVPVYAGYPSVFKRVLWCALVGALTLRRLRGDIYFSPKGFAALHLRSVGGAKRVVVTIHDLIPLWYAKHFPGSVGRFERAFINGWLKHTVRTSDRIVAISQATADALKAQLSRREGVCVVHNGTPFLPKPTYSGPRDQIFAMTSPLAHKNLRGILDAYSCYRSEAEMPLPMTLCGVAGDFGVGVNAVANIGQTELANFYARAKVFLFLPMIEGFGFPALEAISLGTPVVCSDIPSLHEATGGKATFVPLYDAKACATALLDVTARDSNLQRMSCTQTASSESWELCARDTWRAVIHGIHPALQML